MLEVILASLQKFSNFLKFVPQSLKEEFTSFPEKIERKRKKSRLTRVAKAQRKDPIEEGSMGDNIR